MEGALVTVPNDPDALMALMKVITRVPADASVWEFDPAVPTDVCMRSRDESNRSELEQSGQLAQAILEKAKIDAGKPIAGSFRALVLELSLIFHPKSEGCFNHWATVFQALITRNPGQVLNALTTKANLLEVMLNHVHEGAVFEQMRSIVSRAGNLGESKADDTLRRLAERKLLHLLAARAATGDGRAQAAADLFNAIIVELLQLPEGDRLLSTLDEDLFAELSNPLKDLSAPRERVEPVLSVMRQLLVYSGRKLEEPGPMAHEWPNLLAPHCIKIRAAVLKNLPAIIARLIAPPAKSAQQSTLKLEASASPSTETPPSPSPVAVAPAAALPAPGIPSLPQPAALKKAATMITFSAYKVREPFSSYRILLLGVIVELARKPFPEEGFFDKLDLEFWRTLVAWFFEYPHNNILHCQFYRLFTELVRASHEPSLRALLSKGKFLSRMINAYNDKSIDSRAFILAMCNTLRLTAASLPRTAFLADFLFAHEQWKSFLPTLLAESAAQQPQHQVELAKAIVPQLSPAWRRLPSYNVKDGLDLGSSFSNALGIGTEYEETIEIGGRAVSEDDTVQQPRRPSAKAPPLKAAASMRGNLRGSVTAASTPTPAVAPVLPQPTTTTSTPAAATGSPSTDKKKKKKKKKTYKEAKDAQKDEPAAP